jgi:hypothetical protein
VNETDNPAHKDPYRKLYARQLRDSPAFKSLDVNGKVTAIYCLAGPDTNVLGLFVVPERSAASWCGLTLRQFQTAISTVVQAFGWEFDESEGVVWLRDTWWAWNPPENAGVLKRIATEVLHVPRTTPLLDRCVRELADRFLRGDVRAFFTRQVELARKGMIEATPKTELARLSALMRTTKRRGNESLGKPMIPQPVSDTVNDTLSSTVAQSVDETVSDTVKQPVSEMVIGTDNHTVTQTVSDLIEHRALSREERSTRRASKERTPDAPKESNPAVREFLSWFREEYRQRRNGADYLIKWERDGQLVKQMLKATSLERLKQLAVVMLSEKCSHPFIVESDRSVPILSMMFNWLSDRVAEWEANHASKQAS